MVTLLEDARYDRGQAVQRSRCEDLVRLWRSRMQRVGQQRVEVTHVHVERKCSHRTGLHTD